MGPVDGIQNSPSWCENSKSGNFLFAAPSQDGNIASQTPGIKKKMKLQQYRVWKNLNFKRVNKLICNTHILIPNYYINTLPAV